LYHNIVSKKIIEHNNNEVTINQPVDGEIVMRGLEESEVESLFMSENEIFNN
jgi:hypothetical protein